LLSGKNRDSSPFSKEPGKRVQSLIFPLWVSPSFSYARVAFLVVFFVVVAAGVSAGGARKASIHSFRPRSPACWAAL